MKVFVVPLILGLLLLGIAFMVRSGKFARANPGEPVNKYWRQAKDGPPQLSEEHARLLAERYPEAQASPSGLRWIVRREGSGPLPAAGDTITAHYEGFFLGGSKFDSSRDRGTPFQFQLGQNRVIPGWEEAFAGMRVGERRTVIVPYWLGYGERGGRAIPAYSTLVFEVERL